LIRSPVSKRRPQRPSDTSTPESRSKEASAELLDLLVRELLDAATVTWPTGKRWAAV
jgi:hypothetical protein